LCDQFQLVDVLISEKDTGIFNAMNKGMKHASGAYFIFMNGGDEFVNSTVLSRIKPFIAKMENDFLYGDTIISHNNSSYYKVARSKKYLFYGMFTHHQSMIYSANIILENNLLYDESLTIGSDYRFTVEFLKFSESDSYLNFPISKFNLDGVSNEDWHKTLIDDFVTRTKFLNLNFLSSSLIFCMHIFMNIFRTVFSSIYLRLRSKL